MEIHHICNRIIQMNLKQIIVRNFRNIGEEKIFSLNENFTVIIGINGKGKSTILHAIRVACGAYFLAIPEVKKTPYNTF